MGKARCPTGYLMDQINMVILMQTDIPTEIVLQMCSPHRKV